VPVDWEFWWTKAVANVNPNAPVVDLPLFLFEFKDMPKMIKHLGNLLTEYEALGNFVKPTKKMLNTLGPDALLAYNFGWKPLVSDLKSMVSLGKSIDDRLRQLRNMARKKRTRRRIGSVESSYEGSSVYLDVAVQGQFWCPVKHDDKTEVWLVARPELLDITPGTAPELWYIMDQALGLAPSYATMWNMIPWSWLIDYFVNVGTYLEAHRGHIRWSMGDAFLMAKTNRKRTVDIDYVRSRSPNGSYSGGVTTCELKSRQYRYNPGPQIAFDPFLSQGQMANLGALVISSALSGKSPEWWS
jgi:hypothetical protein